MTEPARPYTPRSLALRWACSEQHVRNLIARGDLTIFHVGSLIRIRQSEVERVEAGEERCGSSGIEERGAPTGATKKVGPVVDLSARKIAQRRSAGSPTTTRSGGK